MLTQSSDIHLTIGLKEQKKHNTGYSLLSESHSVSPLDYKTPSNPCSKILYSPKAKQNVILKW